MPSSPRCAYRNMGWGSAKSWDRGGTEQDFCSAHPRRTKSTNKTQNVVRSQLSTYSFQTEAPINPKTLSKLALSTVKGRPCPARLPGAVLVPQQPCCLAPMLLPCSTALPHVRADPLAGSPDSPSPHCHAPQSSQASKNHNLTWQSLFSFSPARSC